MAIRLGILAGLLLMACTPQSGPDIASVQVGLTPARIAALRTPILLAEASGIGVAATLIPVGQNGPVTTWQTRDGVQISLDGGLIVATRGLGDDIMSAEVSGFRAALQRGGGQYLRRISRLDGNFGLVFTTLNCVLSKGDPTLRPASVTSYQEICQSENHVIRNRYDTDNLRRIRSSRQWIGRAVGYLDVTIIHP